MRELISSLVIGSVLIGSGIALFRYRKAILRHNEQMRRPVLGASLARFMMGGDQLMFPIISALWCAAGVGLIIWTIARVASGH